MFDHRLDVILEADGPTRRDFIKSSAAVVSAGPSVVTGIAKSLGGLSSLNALAEHAWLNSSVFKNVSNMPAGARREILSLDGLLDGRLRAGNISPKSRQARVDGILKQFPAGYHGDLLLAYHWGFINNDGDLSASANAPNSKHWTSAFWAYDGAHSQNTFGKGNFIDLMVEQAGGGKNFLNLFCKDIINLVKDPKVNPLGYDAGGNIAPRETVGFLINVLEDVQELKPFLGGFSAIKSFRDPNLSLWEAESQFINFMHKNGVLSNAEFSNIMKTIKSQSINQSLISKDNDSRVQLRKMHERFKSSQKEYEDYKREKKQEEESKLDRNAISRWEDEGGALPKDLEESINNLLSIII